MTIRRRKIIREKESPQPTLIPSGVLPADSPAPTAPAAQNPPEPRIKDQSQIAKTTSVTDKSPVAAPQTPSVTDKQPVTTPQTTSATEKQPVDASQSAAPAVNASKHVNPAQPIPIEPQDTPPAVNEVEPPPAQKSKFSILQKALIAGVIISAAFLTYSLVQSSKTSKSFESATVRTQIPPKSLPPEQVNLNQQKKSGANPKAADSQDAAAGSDGPLSLQMVEDFYASKEYDKAFYVSSRLRENLKAKDMELVRDFLQLRMALCLKEKGDFGRAEKLLGAVADSRSIVLQVLANYNSCLLEMDAGQYLNARTRAYKVMALTGALNFEDQWPVALERECTFLAAEALTKHILALCDADKDLPRQLWTQPEWQDPLTGLDENELKTVLNVGADRLNSGLLAPQVRPIEQNTASGLTRWSIICNGPGIEELMARFAANASIDLKWLAGNDTSLKQFPKTWNRPVIIYLSSATIQQVATVAAGAAGLIAEVDEKESIRISDPAQYYSLSEYTRKLSDHAIWLWRKLLLVSGDDDRNPDIHFVLAILQSQKNQMAEAIAEYKLVANRYSQTPLAPYALLRSSRIKSNLRNYEGASSDLKILIEQYPDNELIGQVHLELADTTMKTGLFDQACSLYKKAYNLEFSPESKSVASFGAGKCLYELHDYESAIKWLNRYLDSVREQQDSAQSAGNNLYNTYLMLGKANLVLGNIQQAAENLQRTIRKAADSEEYVEAVSALVETQIKQQDFITALGTIENTRAWPFTQEQITRLLLLKSTILREIGLTDKAITMLSERAQYLTDSNLKANIIAELARCYCSTGDVENARKCFTEAVSLYEPGAQSRQASLELADVCLKLNDYGRTVSICNQLLNSSAPEQIKASASKTLAAAYSKQQQYNKAAQTLITAYVK